MSHRDDVLHVRLKPSRVDEYGEKKVLARLTFPCVCTHTTTCCLVVAYGNGHLLIFESVGIIQEIYVCGINFLEMDDVHYYFFDFRQFLEFKEYKE